ncbi:MAG: DUF721 domain-containing protein [Phycisphaerales bacterium]|nr:DUF721 domain-containing protein [Phycisphaerales bacterium]
MTRISPSSNDDSPTALAAARIDLLRKRNRRGERDYAIVGLLEGIRREASRSRKASGNFVDAWEAVVPPEFVRETRVKGLSGGVARVGVRSSAMQYELDRLLRTGLLSELRAAFGGLLRRVKVETDPDPKAWGDPDQDSPDA